MRSSLALAAVLLAGAAIAAPALAQEPFDLMAMADDNRDGKVSGDEYKAFSERGWGFVSQGKDRVKVAELDSMAQLAFLGIRPDAEGFVTKRTYLDAIPRRFAMFDRDKDGFLNSDELNGRAFRPG